MRACGACMHLHRRTITGGVVPVDVLSTEQEDIIVICDDAVHQFGFVQPRALGLSLHGGDDVGQAKHLQQLLALPIHLTGGGVSIAHLGSVLRLQPL